eukprot:m.104745 g.104745  ORF g.104745 m.104745 type:complete len:1586 (+) comp9118_c0_seq1:59-4816(+)
MSKELDLDSFSFQRDMKPNSDSGSDSDSDNGMDDKVDDNVYIPDESEDEQRDDDDDNDDDYEEEVNVADEDDDEDHNLWEEMQRNPEVFSLRRSNRSRHQRNDFQREQFEQQRREEEARAKTRALMGNRARGSSRNRAGRKQTVLQDSSESEKSDYLDESEEDTDASEDWNPSGKKKSRSKKAQPFARSQRKQRVTSRQRRGGYDSDASSSDSDDYKGSDDDDDDGDRVARRFNARTKKVVSYKEVDDMADVSETELAEFKKSLEQKDDREKIQEVLDCRTRSFVAQEMRDMLENNRIILGDAELPEGKELEIVEEELDSSIVSVMGKTEDDVVAVEQDGDSDDVLYCVKWEGRSHLHNTWQTEHSLKRMDIGGLGKMDRFIRKYAESEEEINHSSTTTEMREYLNCEKEERVAKKAQHKIIDRIVMGSDEVMEDVQYLCKWKGLEYSECTWENSDIISGRYQRLIDDFLLRQSSSTLPCNGTRRSSKPFRVIREQPDWLPPSLSLRDYQMTGVSWLGRSWYDNRSVILADEMGLGKTIQCVSFLSYLFNVHKVYGPFLVVVPLSTLGAWQDEFTKWAPQLNTIVYGGKKGDREKVREFEFRNQRNKLKFNVLLTTYDMVRFDVEILKPIRWVSLIVDEAHSLKNDEGKLHLCLADLRHDHRVLVTGTPLQNSLRELWALLHFIMPKEFFKWSQFEEDYPGLSENLFGNHQELATLRANIKPYLLRRVKKDVEKSLPNKIEQILRVGLSKRQKTLYKHIISRNYMELTRERGGERTNLSNIIMELKKCCNHAFLIDHSICNNPDMSQSENIRNMLKGSGKLLLLDKLLLRLKEKGSRVLIFSQMVIMLEILQVFLQMRGYPFQRLDGNIPNDVRKRSIAHFNAPGSKDFCFILSTRAGGLGVNLASADTVIIYDSDWNPQNDLQAQARAHRIGQKKQVHIYRFVSKSTVEEDILQRAKEKMVLDHLVIQNGNKQFDQRELNAIIKFGAADLFKDDDNANDKDGEEKKDIENGIVGAGEGDEDFDLDAVLDQAEISNTSENSTATSELLSAFNTVDIVTNEDELEEEARLEDEMKRKERLAEEKKKSKKMQREKERNSAEAISWDEIIPEKIREHLQEQASQRKIEAMMLAPRKRRVKYNNLDSTVDEDHSSHKLSKSSHIAELEKAGVGKYTVEEVRNLVVAVRRYGWYNAEKKKLILNEARLETRDVADIDKLANHVEELCRKRKKEIDACKEAEMKKSLRQVVLGSFKMNAEDYIVRIDGLAALDKRVKLEGSKFRIHTKVKLPQWDCEWTPQCDAMLLRGVSIHGIGAWAAIKADDSFPILNDKIVPSDSKLKPQDTHLKGRVETLLKMFLKAPKRSKPLEMKPSSSTSTTPKKQKTQSSLKSFALKSQNKKAGDHESESDFVIGKASNSLIAKWMKPVKNSIQSIGGEDVNALKKAVQDVGHFIQSLLQNLGETYDSVELKTKIWEYVVKIAKPHETKEDVAVYAKKLRKLYKVFSKPKVSKPKKAAKSPSSSSSASSKKANKKINSNLEPQKRSKKSSASTSSSGKRSSTGSSDNAKRAKKKNPTNGQKKQKKLTSFMKK